MFFYFVKYGFGSKIDSRRDVGESFVSVFVRGCGRGFLVVRRIGRFEVFVGWRRVVFVFLFFCWGVCFGSASF